jgi:hypothetical protein
MIQVELTEQEASDVLKVLFNGNGRPARVHTLVCLCGSRADLRKDPHAWDGWTVAPVARCPLCNETPPADDQASELGPTRARVLFEVQLKKVKGGCP